MPQPHPDRPYETPLPTPARPAEEHPTPHDSGHPEAPAHDPARHLDGTGGTWRTATRATAHCLTGCALGKVLGTATGTALSWGDTETATLATLLALFFGYLLTLRGVLGIGFRAAVRVALAAGAVSVAVLRTVDSGVVALWPRAPHAGPGEWPFWVSLAAGLALAFAVALPVNRWLIGRGRGHAVTRTR